MSLASNFQTPDSLFMNGSPSAEAEMLMNQSLLEQGLMLQGRRRGRKRKEEKLAEIAMAEALARRQMARAVASFEPGKVSWKNMQSRNSLIYMHCLHRPICLK